jgi:hypothetical protein
VSIVLVRAALESALNGMSPALSTAWENHAFTPPAVSTPYQRAFLLAARPDNQVFGSAYFEQGIFQIDLMYPQQSGSAAAAARAELLRSTFSRGASFTSGGVTVRISDTPEVMPGMNEESRYRITVKIRFFAQIP